MKILFYKGRADENPRSQFFDHVICFFTRSRFSHVEIVESELNPGVYSTWSCSPRDMKVRNSTIDISNGSWVVRDIDFNPETVLDWFRKHEGQNYNYIGLIGVWLPFDINPFSDTWFCSEAIAAAGDVPRPWKITPEKLYLKSY